MALHPEAHRQIGCKGRFPATTRLHRLLTLLLLTLSIADTPAIDARLLRQPDISATQIAFVYAGDIWVVARDGGRAARLSSPPGEERLPRFSPDGSRIAFSANYDGNTDVYQMNAGGGPVTRVTHHPQSDQVVDWSADGRSLFFTSPMDAGMGQVNRLYETSSEGGLPRVLPLPHVAAAAVSPTGEWVAFTPRLRQGSWKRYRGGAAPEIGLFNLKTLESRWISNQNASDDSPMWHKDTLYFASDRGPEQRFNLWAYSIVQNTFRQLTHFEREDVHDPSIGPSDIVYVAAGRMHRLDLESGQDRVVEIEVVTDLASLKPQIKNVSALKANETISPSGKRIVFGARGDLFSVPAEHGPTINLTQTPGIAEIFPAISPDGKQVAYWTDRTGEYELAVRSLDGSGQEQILSALGPGFRYTPAWSPDGRKIAFVDHQMTLRVFLVAEKQDIKVDQLDWTFHGTLRTFRPAWSGDSRWLAYARLLPNQLSGLFLHDTSSNRVHQMTSGFYSDHSPAFDPEGKYLYFLTDREMQPIYGAIDGTMWTYANATRIAALSLRTNVPSLLAPRNDTEEAAGSKDKDKDKSKDKEDKPSKSEDKQAVEPKPAEDKDSKTADDAKARQDSKKPVEPVTVDFEEAERRIVVLPPPAGNYGRLDAVAGKIVFQRRPESGSSAKKGKLAFYDFKERKEETVLDEVDSFQLTGDRQKALVGRGQELAILELKKDQKFEKPLAVSGLEMRIDPRAEWRQIFNDVWRLNRDYFYDPNMHGLDWNALRTQYGGLLEEATTRWDVHFVIGELIGELNASHTYRGGGDVEQPRSRATGMLGIDWILENGAYRIRRIIRGAPWDHQVRSAFDQPGLNVREGDYVLAVNGASIDPSRDPWAAFEGLADQTVTLIVNDKPTRDEARELLVETLTPQEESELRYLGWMEDNRKHVAGKSQGRIGYIHMPDTARRGQDNLFRQFTAQSHLPGLIIDERFNGGGQLADRFLELLKRSSFAFLAHRHGRDLQWPPIAHFGPQAMLINGWSGSGGDALPWFFRTARRGPIIGVRTWGGLIGPAVSHGLVDGGSVVIPPARLYSPDGQWFAEGHGVEPDIVVREDPTALAKGIDTQLDRAIEEIEKQLRSGGEWKPPARPAFEKR